MMDIRKEMDAAIARLAAAKIERREAEQHMRDIADQCTHVWDFKEQTNAFNNNLWNVTWKCRLCDDTKVNAKIPPICETCHSELKRASSSDVEAEAERKKPEHQGHYNPPEAWRCTACNQIHILHLLGD